MPTNDELWEWCRLKAEKETFPLGSEVRMLERELTIRRVTRLLQEAYEYGFSQGAGGRSGN